MSPAKRGIEWLETESGIKPSRNDSKIKPATAAGPEGLWPGGIRGAFFPTGSKNRQPHFKSQRKENLCLIWTPYVRIARENSN